MAPNFSDRSSQVLVNSMPCLMGALLLYFFYTRFGLEPLLMSRLFRTHYTSLTVINKRPFTSHCLWLAVKICLIPAAWPFIAVFFCHNSLRDPLSPGTHISNADFLSVAFIAVISMFLFEIIYRLKISPVTLIHHTAGCGLAAWQVVEQVMRDDAEAESQFRLLVLYGVLEVVFETFPHIAVIYYRCQAKTAVEMKKTSKIWLVSGCSSLVGTSGELVAIALFMWRNWKFWGFAMKVISPILHFAFVAAQIYGARIGFQLWREFGERPRKAEIEERRAGSTGSGSTAAEKGADVTVTIAETEGLTGPVVEQDVTEVRLEREPSAEPVSEQEGAELCRTCPDAVTRWVGEPRTGPAAC